MIPDDTPIDRILPNMQTFVQENPDDPEGHYRLGRVHGLVLEFNREAIVAYAAWGNQTHTRPGSRHQQGRQYGRVNADKPSKRERIEHLRLAVTHLNRAIELDPTQAKYHLALAAVLESGIELAEQADVHPLVLEEFPNDDESWDRRLQPIVDGDIHDRLKEINEEIITSAEWTREPGPTARDKFIAALWAKRDVEDKAARQRIRAYLALDWKERITDEYFEAMTLALPQYSKQDELPIWGSIADWVAYEAANYYLLAIEARGGPRPQDQIRVRVAETTRQAIKDLPFPSAITPIIFSFRDGTTYADCISDTTVSFDLDGTARDLRWSWVTPQTGILVWDPNCTGRITSGTQLFGSVSWWCFYEHGYQALDALDNNRDGELTEDELNGIAVWFDHDSNGVSDPGEVIPIEQLPIAAIATTQNDCVGDAPMNSAGLRLNDGSTRPTWDWIAETTGATEHEE